MNDYGYDMTEEKDADGNVTRRLLVTYAYGGFEIDRRESSPADTGGLKSWTDLMTEALPAIQSDLDTFGVIQ
jgi:hypothetical protein